MMHPVACRNNLLFRTLYLFHSQFNDYFKTFGVKGLILSVGSSFLNIYPELYTALSGSGSISDGLYWAKIFDLWQRPVQIGLVLMAHAIVSEGYHILTGFLFGDSFSF